MVNLNSTASNRIVIISPEGMCAEKKVDQINFNFYPPCCMKARYLSQDFSITAYHMFRRMARVESTNSVSTL